MRVKTLSRRPSYYRLCLFPSSAKKVSSYFKSKLDVEIVLVENYSPPSWTFFGMSVTPFYGMSVFPFISQFLFNS